MVWLYRRGTRKLPTNSLGSREFFALSGLIGAIGVIGVIGAIGAIGAIRELKIEN